MILSCFIQPAIALLTRKYIFDGKYYKNWPFLVKAPLLTEFAKTSLQEFIDSLGINDDVKIKSSRDLIHVERISTDYIYYVRYDEMIRH